jgi:hypothetical protein
MLRYLKQHTIYVVFTRIQNNTYIVHYATLLMKSTYLLHYFRYVALFCIVQYTRHISTDPKQHVYSALLKECYTNYLVHYIHHIYIIFTIPNTLTQYKA